MRTLLYEGFILTNQDGSTNTWTLTIGSQTRVGSLFELRRQVHFYRELGVLPPEQDDPTFYEPKSHNSPIDSNSPPPKTRRPTATKK